METRFHDLSGEEELALTQGLDLAAKLLDVKRPLSIENVQTLYDVFLSDEPDFVEGEIALGLSFGQLFVELNDYEWVRINDEYGQETCIAPKSLKINCAPISMIRKRLSQQETLDIRELLEGTKVAIQNLIDAGEYEKR